MILAGYTKFTSKKGKDLCIVHFLVPNKSQNGGGYKPYVDAKGFVGMWADPDIEIDESLFLEEVKPVREFNEDGFEILVGVEAV